jgi:hypothetical protein
MKIGCMQLGSIALLMSLVACAGVNESESGVGDEVAGEDGDDLGTAEQNLCAWSTLGPSEWLPDDADSLASEAGYAYVDGEADGGCDPYSAVFTANSTHRIKSLDVSATLDPSEPCAPPKRVKVWAYQPSTSSWVSIPVTTTVHPPSPPFNFVCYIDMHKDFPSNNTYTAIYTEVWVEDQEPTVSIYGQHW